MTWGRGNSDGGLLVEFVLAASFTAFLLAVVVALLRTATDQQKVLLAARLGTLLQSAGVPPEVARAEVSRLVPKDATIVTGRYDETAAARFYQFVRTRISLPNKVRADIVCEREEE